MNALRPDSSRLTTRQAMKPSSATVNGLGHSSADMYVYRHFCMSFLSWNVSCQGTVCLLVITVGFWRIALRHSHRHSVVETAVLARSLLLLSFFAPGSAKFCRLCV